MTATLICVLVTPCTPVSGMFLCNAAPDTSEIGGAPGFVVGAAIGFEEPAFPHATARIATAMDVASVRERMHPPGDWAGARDRRGSPHLASCIPPRVYAIYDVVAGRGCCERAWRVRPVRSQRSGWR